MENFLLGLVTGMSLFVLQGMFRMAKVEPEYLKAIFRLYGGNATLLGAVLLVCGALPHYLGKWNPKFTADVAHATVDAWPEWLMGVGMALIALSYLVLKLVVESTRVRQEVERARPTPSPQESTREDRSQQTPP